MTTPEQTLVRLLVNRTPLPGTAIPWPAVAEVAIQWHVGSFLLSRLDSYGGEVPAAVRTLLIHHHRQTFSRSALLAANGARICRVLEDQGIPVIAFKGLGVMAQLYAGSHERSTRDVDLLVEEENLDSAVAALSAAGLAVEHKGDLATYREKLRELNGMVGNQSVNLHHPDWGDVDLHWRFGRNPAEELNPARIFGRSEWRPLFGHQIRVVGPMDGLVLAAHHAIRENFNPATMLRDVLDTQRWLERLEALGEFDAALSHVERCRMAEPVAAIASLLGHRGVLERLGNTSASRDLALLFEMQMSGDSVNRDAQRLLDPREWQKMWRYGIGGVAGYQQLMSVHVPGQRVPWAERFGRLGRILGGLKLTKWRRWRALRTLVRVRANYQDSSNQ